MPSNRKILNELEHGTLFLKVFNDYSFMSARYFFKEPCAKCPVAQFIHLNFH